MKKTSLSIITIVIALFGNLSSIIKAQDTDNLAAEIDIYTQIELPPLELLFLNSRTSSNVNFFNARKEAEVSMLKTVKNEWLKYFKIVGSYQYGILGGSATSSDPTNTQTTPVYRLSNSKQTVYNIGFALSVPLDELFDRGNKVRRQKMEMKATEAEVERWYDEQKLRIIEIYSKAQLYLNLIKIKTEAMIIAKAQYKVAESDFVNGKIRPSDLSARKGVETDATVNYEQAKSELTMSLLQLEVLSNTQILKKETR